ncbi:MAG TPA: hypothetical protein PLE45_07285 [Spirochaetota bacterium]|nr:hypothetical protein [Spirochaetota bacterium]HOL58209.1 hypothetical protein [Spirochaetota bacterium]HPP04582.1 hypothetical protein [Spirochaetota bacterium]
MADFSLEGVKNFFDKSKSKVINVVKKIVAGILGLGVIGSIVLALIFLALIKIFPIMSIYFIVQAGIFLLLSFLVLKIPDFSRKHYVAKEIKECENLFNEIKKYINDNDKIKAEFKGIIKDLNEGIKQAKDLANRIYSIENTLAKKDWDISYITNKIKKEESKSDKDEMILKRLMEQKDNINKLTNLQNNFINQLSGIKHTFNSVYTKLTLIDTSNRADFDSVETEIQKILDFKLKVAKYEEELDKELKI